jgi:outer membrane lipoprotein SlyB
MKRIITILAAGLTLFLTGCATNYDAYAKAQSEIATAQSNAETARLVALARIAESGDAGAKVGAVMALALSGQRGQTQLQAPGDPVLEWVKALAGPLVNIWGITENNRTARLASDNAVKTHGITFGTLENIAVTGMEEAGKVTIPPVYAVPMGSAPAAAVEATPITATPATE